MAAARDVAPASAMARVASLVKPLQARPTFASDWTTPSSRCSTRAGSAWRRPAHSTASPSSPACRRRDRADRARGSARRIRSVPTRRRHDGRTCRVRWCASGRGRRGYRRWDGHGRMGGARGGALSRRGWGFPISDEGSGRGSGANSRAVCFGRMMGVRLGPAADRCLRAVWFRPPCDRALDVRRSRATLPSWPHRRATRGPERPRRCELMQSAGRHVDGLAERPPRDRCATDGAGRRTVVEPRAVAQPGDEASVGSSGRRCTRRRPVARSSGSRARGVRQLIRRVVCHGRAAQDSRRADGERNS